MSQASEYDIIVYGGRDERYMSGEARERQIIRKSMTELASEVGGVAAGLAAMLDGLHGDAEHFKLEECEVSLEIEANGKVAILGTGMELGAAGGIKLLYRKR